MHEGIDIIRYPEKLWFYSHQFSFLAEILRLVKNLFIERHAYTFILPRINWTATPPE